MKITVRVPDKKSAFFIQLLNELDFVSLEEVKSDEDTATVNALPSEIDFSTLVNTQRATSPSDATFNDAAAVNALQKEIDDIFGK